MGIIIWEWEQQESFLHTSNLVWIQYVLTFALMTALFYTPDPDYDFEELCNEADVRVSTPWEKLLPPAVS